ncbi:MAG: NYN domain-containing protein [Candidatus Babeliales bacterium]|jgi:predicted RNA-binding protein with PIN domain
MIVVIDGYNLLKQIFPHVKGRIDKERNAFIRQLGYYKSRKPKEIKELIVVFDAGPFSHATREIHEGVTVMFSGQKSTADDWIIEYADSHKGMDVLVVTMDRKIIQACEKAGATTLGSLDFYGIMQSFLLEEAAQELSTQAVVPGATTVLEVEKYDQDDEELNGKKVDRKALDMMMEQAGFFVNKEDDVDLDRGKSRKSASSKLSKKDRQLLSKVKKLH